MAAKAIHNEPRTAVGERHYGRAPACPSFRFYGKSARQNTEKMNDIRERHARSTDSKLSPTAYMRMVASVAAIAGGLYGYDTGIISGALPLIARDFGLGYRAQELVAAMILLGAVIGALCSTRMSATLGRRRTIMIISVVYSFGVVAAALSPGVWRLALSRLVLGFAVGGSTQIVPTYIAELAEPEKRGRLVTYFNVSIGIGILLAAIIGVAGNEMFNWRWMIGVAVVPSLILTFGMTKLPGSPRWLVEQDRIQDARTALLKVRDSRETVHRELADMQDVPRCHVVGVESAAHRQRTDDDDMARRWRRNVGVCGAQRARVGVHLPDRARNARQEP